MPLCTICFSLAAVVILAAYARGYDAANDGFIDDQGKLQLDAIVEEETLESTCSLESIYLYDSHKLAKLADVPTCDVGEMFVVAPLSGQIYLRGSREAAKHGATDSHFFGTHSAAWYLAEAVRDSKYETSEIGVAGSIFVEDYCYYMWWLAAAQSEDATGPSPIEYLIKIYDKLRITDAWKSSQGKRFVFFLPFHTNVVGPYQKKISGHEALVAYTELLCTDLRPALQITTENLQGRTVCGRNQTSSLVAPLVPNVRNSGGQVLSESLRDHMLDSPSLHKRTTSVFFHGGCAHVARSNPSRLLRSHVVDAIQRQSEDIHAVCTDRGSHLHIPFKDMTEQMGKSIFCLILPENGQSARALSEAMLAGCIPVFVGPPFAAMPFQDNLMYSEFSFSILLRDNAAWTQQAGAVSKVNRGEFGHDYMPMYASLPNATHLMQLLHEVPEIVLRQKLNEVKLTKENFFYAPELNAGSPSATDLLVISLCRHMKLLASQ